MDKTSMKVFTKREVILGVRDLWMRTYKTFPDDRAPIWDKAKTFGSIRENLSALDLYTCSGTDIDNTLGVSGWAQNQCDNCEADVEKVMVFTFYDESFALCKNCLEEAVKLL